MKKLCVLALSTVSLILLVHQTCHAFTLYWKDGHTQELRDIKVVNNAVDCQEAKSGLWFLVQVDRVDLEKTLVSKKIEEERAAYKAVVGDKIWSINQDQYELIKLFTVTKQTRRVKEDANALGLKKGQVVRIHNAGQDNTMALFINYDGRIINIPCSNGLLQTESEYIAALNEERRIMAEEENQRRLEAEKKRLEEARIIEEKRLAEEKIKLEEDIRTYRRKVGEKIWKANDGKLDVIKKWADINQYKRVLENKNGSLQRGAKVKVMSEDSGYSEIMYLTSKQKIISVKVNSDTIADEIVYRQRLEMEAQEKKQKLEMEAREKKQKAEQARLETIANDPGPEPTASAWNGVAYAVDFYFKNSLKDYDSLEVVDCSPLVKAKGGWLQRVKYRAKNSFGGYVLANNIFLIYNNTVIDVAGND